MSGTGLGTDREVQDGSGHAPGGPGRIGRPTGRFKTGQETIGKIQDGSGDPRRFGTVHRTLGEVREGSGYPPRCPRRVVGPSEGFGTVVGPSGMSGTGLRTHREVRDG